MIRIHFPFADRGTTALPLAIACRLDSARDTNPIQGRYDRLIEYARHHWQVAPLDDADLVVYPHRYEHNAETRRVAEMARQRNLPCLFFRNTDEVHPAHAPYGLVYRPSILASRLSPSERAMPAMSEDMLAYRNHQPCPAQWTQRPRVGFCGYVGHTLSRAFYLLTGRYHNAIGLILRHKALRQLKAHPQVDAAVIARHAFFAGVAKGSGKSHAQTLRIAREQFVSNLFETQYTLCLRGKGNYSFRFYETLSAGRIPLFINTDCVLPLADQIDYRKHCVWVERNEMHRLGDILVDFHRSHDDDTLRQIQLDNRQLWAENFSPETYFPRIVREALQPDSPARQANE